MSARATIDGNDVSGHNTSCARGFHIPPFSVPTTVPGLGIPITEGLHNGWAGIMVDVTRGTSPRHDPRATASTTPSAATGSTSGLRAPRDVRATIAANDVRELRQGDGLESILAIGLQTRDRARLVGAARRTTASPASATTRTSGIGPDRAPTPRASS